jgi:rod shape determining protein RodA
VNIYSASWSEVSSSGIKLYEKQIIWVILGLSLMFILSVINYQLIGYYAVYIYAGGIILLVLTLLFAAPIKNARRWLDFGLINVQPSELIKLAFIIILGKYIDLRGRDIRNFRELLFTSLIFFIPFALILLQPDLGSGLSLIPIYLIMLFVGGADNTHLASIVAIGIITLMIPMITTYRDMVGLTAGDPGFLIHFIAEPKNVIITGLVFTVISMALYSVKFFLNLKILRRIYIPTTVVSLGFTLSFFVAKYFKPYQKKRLLTFFNPELDPLGSAYNIIQSKIAVGSGGFFGKGFLKGTQNQLGFLPEKSTDFIFSVLAEEWGFLGTIVVLILFLAIIVKGIKIAYESKDLYGSLLAAGITSLIFYHVIVNIGMSMGIMPVTGLLLPFISYGGSNLIISLIAIGILLNIRMKKFAN